MNTTSENPGPSPAPFSFRKNLEVWKQMIAEARQFAQAAEDPFEIIQAWLAPVYAAEVRLQLEETPSGQQRMEILRSFIVHWARLQTLHLASVKLKLVHSPAWRTHWLRRLAANLPPYPGISG